MLCIILLPLCWPATDAEQMEDGWGMLLVEIDVVGRVAGKESQDQHGLG